ncbi:MAG: response regulator, partial [Vallitaleaceae bacterium]|nr:response regulator [Vallitaleaceae bacterium]
MIKFNIKDTGIGLTQTELGKLFKQFTQVESDTTRSYGGTGLGLSISKQLTELMSGTIEVTSQKNVGSDFYLTLPFKYNSNYQVEPRRPSFHNFRAMIVDDSQTACDVLGYYLGLYTSDIDICFSGEEAVDLYEQADNQYDIIFMDWKMATMNGIEASEKIMALDRAHKTKIVLVTAYLKEEVLTAVDEQNIDGFLYKPVTPYDLEGVLNKIYLDTYDLDNKDNKENNLDP